MVRKNFKICPSDITIAVKKIQYIQVKRKPREFRKIVGYGLGPKKKPTYKERMEKKMKKQIKNAKLAGFEKNKKICIAIGQYIYNPRIVNILITGKIKVIYFNTEERIYSLKMLKTMKENVKYIKQQMYHQWIRRNKMRYTIYN
tara:strand:+ start:191 stop:622 length:432 start_codon:yes stop_codon:yes gene_type:complete